MTIIEEQARSIFLAALERAPDQWPAFLDEASGGNAQLRARLDQLLHAHQAMGSIHGGGAHAPVATVDEPTAGERPGTVIGAYKVLEQIGEGGFGVVFMAEQQHPVRRKVALKVLKPGMDTRQVVARFEAERQALALMDHPNIAQVFDGGETTSGRPYFVMELVKGLPITEYCDQAQWTPRERLELFVHVCHAVQHAHQKGIIHRDIKPSNVLVTLHDGTAVVKVIDFGIAKALGQQLTDKTLFTTFAQMIGTPLYMSPEQAGLSGLDVDTRSDVYSLGVLLYELLTGTTPFDKERFKETGYDEMRRIIREEEPPRPSSRINTLGQAATTISTQRKSDPKRLSQLCRGELDWIVMKCLEKDRNRRYETASALARDIERYLHDEPVHACPPSATYRFRKFARRHKARLVIAGLFLFLIVLLGGGAGWMVRDRAVRREETHREVTSAVAEARRQQGKGQWAEARESSRRAEGLLAGGSADEELHRLVQELLADLEGNQRDRQMLAQLAEIHLGQDALAAEEAYARAFQSYGIDVENLEAREAANRLGERGIAVEMAAALDHWAELRRRKDQHGRWKHLLAVARRADPHEWRCQLREALERRDRQALIQFAASDHIATLQPPQLDVLANALSHLQALEHAVAFLRRAQGQSPGDFWANYLLAVFLVRSRPPHTEEAIGFYRAALALRPQNPMVYANLAIVHFDRGNLKDAVDAATRAIELNPRLLAVRAQRGKAYLSLGQPDKALADFSRVIEVNQTPARLWIDRGTTYMRLGRAAKAEADFREALRRRPKNLPEAYHGLGNALREQDRLLEAEAAYRQAIVLQPDAPEPHCMLGLVLGEQGHFIESLASLRHAHKLGSKRLNWRQPTAEFVREAEQVVALDAKLARILRGEAEPANAAERLALAGLCQKYKRLYATAARFFAEAVAADPKLADNPRTLERYNAAGAAAQAGCGQGNDAANLDDKERARLRRQAMDWLRADLTALGQFLEKKPDPQTRAGVQQMLRQWQQDAAFAGVRGDALARLPEVERQAWHQLWADVEQALRKRNSKDAKDTNKKPSK